MRSKRRCNDVLKDRDRSHYFTLGLLSSPCLGRGMADLASQQIDCSTSLSMTIFCYNTYTYTSISPVQGQQAHSIIVLKSATTDALIVADK